MKSTDAIFALDAAFFIPTVELVVIPAYTSDNLSKKRVPIHLEGGDIGV